MLFGLDTAPLSIVVGGFLVCAGGHRRAGTLLARRADVIADRTGLGEALVGAVLLGGSTSLPGTITSVATAWEGYPVLSISNAIGGITAQTAFLAGADMFYRRANLEHATAYAAAPSAACGVTTVSSPLPDSQQSRGLVVLVKRRRTGFGTR